MKGLIFDIKRFALQDGPGIRTTVFFMGCPILCRWCHNPESTFSSPKKIVAEKRLGKAVFRETEIIGKYYTVDEIWKEIIKDSIFYEESGGGVTFSGGEPLAQKDFLLHLLMVSKTNNIHTAIDTSGFAPFADFKPIIPFTDLILYDIKHLENKKHEKYTGFSNKLILQNLELLANERIQIIIRFPLIPGINDNDHHLSQFKNFLYSYKGKINEVHILPYHQMAHEKYKKIGLKNRMPKTKNYTLDKLEQIQKKICVPGFNIKIEA